MKKMVVGLVTTGFDKGGLEQVIFNLYEGYRAAGIPTYILCQNGSQMGYFASRLHDTRDFCVFEGDFETFISFCYRHNITHLHYHYNTSFIEQSRRCGIHTIYTLHNVYTWFGESDIERYANDLRKCDKIVAVSSYVKDYFCLRGKCRSDRVEVIPNGINIKEIEQEITLPKKLTREHFGLTKNDIVFAQVASFTSVKHQIGLVGVMEEVIKKGKNIHLLLVGNIIEEAYFTEFQQVLANSSAKSNIIVVPFFEHQFMGEFLRQTVDVSVLATLQEGCSNYVLEAKACKKPMVLTNVGNAREVFTKSVLLVDPAYENINDCLMNKLVQIARQKTCKNTQALADAFLQIAQNLEEFKENACIQEKQLDEIGINQMVDNYISLLKSAI